MKNRIFVAVVIMVLVVGLTGCFCSNEMESFPTYFVRISDGVQLRLGHRDEILQYFGYDEKLPGVTFFPNDFGEVFALSITSEDWMFADGISVGDNIQSVTDNNPFLHTLHSVDSRSFSFTDVDSFESPTYWLRVHYDEDGIITSMRLSYMPEVMALYEQQNE